MGAFFDVTLISPSAYPGVSGYIAFEPSILSNPGMQLVASSMRPFSLVQQLRL